MFCLQGCKLARETQRGEEDAHPGACGEREGASALSGEETGPSKARSKSRVAQSSHSPDVQGRGP